MKYQKITISGRICTGKSSLFRALEANLKWPTFSTGAYFREYARTHNLVLNDAQEQTKRLTTKVDSMVREKLRGEGNLLVDAWLGGMLAENIPGVLKILLVADDKVRWERFAKRENTDLETAKAEMTSRDNSWFEKVSVIHNRDDFFDRSKYDLVIDTSHLPLEKIVQTVTQKLG